MFFCAMSDNARMYAEVRCVECENSLDGRKERAVMRFVVMNRICA